MIYDNIIKYTIISFIMLSAIFYWGAYAAGVAAFLIIIIKEPKAIIKLINREKVVALVVAALLLSALLSKFPGYSIQIFGIVLIHLMVYLVLLRWVDKDNIEGLFWLLNIMGILICTYGIYQFFTGDLIVASSWTDKRTYGSLLRIYSTMRNPNMFAAYLTFNICYAVAYFIKKREDVYVAINIMLSSLCLILTYSRGGFAAFVAAMLVIAIVCKEIKAWVYLGTMILLYYGYNVLEHTNRTDVSALIIDSSSKYRLEIWKATWSLFKENMLFGNGLGSVSKLLSYSSDKLKGYIAHAHNIPLNLLAETGLIGFSAFTLLIISSIKRFFSFWRIHSSNEDSYIAVGYIAALTSMLVHGMVDCAVLVPSRSLIFLVYFALFSAFYIRVSSNKSA